MANNIAFELTANPIPVEEAFRRAGIAGDTAFKKVNTAISSQTGLIDTLKIRINALQQARDAAFDPAKIERINKIIATAEARMKGLTQATQETAKQTGFLSGKMQQLGGYVLAAFSIGAVIGFEKALISASNKMESLRVRMEGLKGSADAGNAALESLKKMAKETGLNFSELAQNYFQFVAAAKAQNKSINEADVIFRNMSIAIAGSGASSEQATAAMRAMVQILGKGKLSAEEIRQQLGEALPQAVGWMAKSMNIGVAEFNKLLDSGKIGTEVLTKFSETAKDAMGETAQKLAISQAANITRMKNAWESYLASLGERTSQSSTFSALADLLEWWEAINQSQDQYIRKMRASLLNNEKQAAQVVKETEELREQKKTNIEIINVLEERKQKAIQEAKKYTNIPELVTERGLLVDAYNEEINALKLASDTKTTLSDAEIKKIQQLEKEYDNLIHQYNLARIELSKLSYIEQQEAVITENTRFEIEQQKIKFKETNATAEQQNTIINAITKKGEDSKKKIREDAAKEMEDFFIKSNEEHLKNVQLSAQRENDIIELADAKKEAQAIKAYEQQKANIESVNKALLNSSTVNKESIKGFKENRDAQLKYFDEQIKNEANFFATGYQSREEFDKNTRKLQEDRKTFEIESEKQLWQKKLAIATYYGQAIAQVGIELVNLKSAQLTREQNDLQQARDAGVITEQTYNAQVREIQHKQFELNRIASLAQIVISTALAAANASVPAAFTAYITLPELLAITIGIGAVQAAAVLAAPNPYAEGTKRVKGGRKGKDSVPYLEPNGWAMLMPDEMIVPEQKVRQHSPYLDNMFDGNISPRQSMWAADLFVSKRVSPGLLDYITSISGGRMNYNSTFTDRGIIDAIQRKAVPNFQREAKQIVNAVSKLKSDNHRNWKR